MPRRYPRAFFERALKSLLPNLNTAVFDTAAKKEIFITAVNPVNHDADSVIEAFIDIPADIDTGDFDVLDAAKNKLTKDIISRQSIQPILEQMINRPMHLDMIRYHVYLQLEQVPAFGMKSFQVVPSQKNKNNVETQAAQGNNSPVLENAFLKVEVQVDGSLDVYDKKQDAFYEGVAFFEDHGEAGHAWVLDKKEPVFSTKGSRANVSRTHAGEAYNEVTVTHRMELPKNLQARMEGSDDTTVNTIVMRVGLGRTHRHLTLNIEADNHAESHRLRLLVPTRLQAALSHGEGQFDVPARSLERLIPQTGLNSPCMTSPCIILWM